MRHFPGWFLPLMVGLMLGLAANFSVRAETQAAGIYQFVADSDSAWKVSSPIEACSTWLTRLPITGCVLNSWYANNTQFNVRAVWSGNTQYQFFSGVISCPPNQNWTLSNGVCSRPDCVSPQTRDPATGQCLAACGADQYRQDGVCKCTNGSQIGSNGSCCPAPGSGGGAAMQWCYVSGPTATSCDSGGKNGCAVRCNNVTFQKGTGDQVNIYPKQALGQGCGYTGLKTASDSPGGGEMTNEQLKEVSEATKDPAKAKTPEGCLGAGMGYITSGGVTSCVSSGEGGEVKKTETGTKTEAVKNPTTGATENKTTETNSTETTKADGTKQTTETATTTNSDGTKTVTTTTKTQNADGTVTETTKQETVASNGTKTTDKETSETAKTGTWCEKNPTDPICLKESDQCKLYPDRASCMDAGEAPVEGALESKSIGVSSFSVVDFAGINSCPAGLALPDGLGFYDWAPMCQFADALKPLVLAMAWLSAGLIVFYGRS